MLILCFLLLIIEIWVVFFSLVSEGVILFLMSEYNFVGGIFVVILMFMIGILLKENFLSDGESILLGSVESIVFILCCVFCKVVLGLELFFSCSMIMDMFFMEVDFS